MRTITGFAIALFLLTPSLAFAACEEGYYNCGSNLCCPK